jgi:iron complex outermembrane receptor protein/vitamin B12 transporter
MRPETRLTDKERDDHSAYARIAAAAPAATSAKAEHPSQRLWWLINSSPLPACHAPRGVPARDVVQCAVITALRTSLVALLLAAARLSAQGAPAPEPTPAPHFYTTATVEARPAASSARPIGIVTRPEIDAAGAASAGDVVTLLPGVHLQRAGGRAASAHLQLRGGDPNFTLVLLDGVPLNDPMDTQGGAVDLEGLPAEALERAEVVRGPASAFYGSTALSGVVQLFSRADSARVAASLQAGDASSLRASLRGGMLLRGEAGRAFALVTREQETGRVADERLRQWNALGGASLESDNVGLRLRARVGSRDTRDYPEASGGPLYGSGLTRTSAADEVNLLAEIDLGSGPRRHSLGLAFQRRALARSSPEVVFVPASDEDTRYRRWRLHWRAAILSGERARLDAGATWEREQATGGTTLRLPPDSGGDLPGLYDVARGVGGPFLDAQFVRGDWHLEAGLRVDLSEATRPQWSPRAGVSLRLGGGATRLRAAAGRAFKLPGFFALASPPLLGGNPDLRPETSWGGEAGLTHAWGAGAEAELTLFAQRYRDLIDFDFESFGHLNRRAVRVRGFEGALRVGPRRLRLEGLLTWQRAEEDDGVPLLQRPRVVGHAGLTWRPSPAWRARLDLRGASSALDQQLPVIERERVDGYALVGAGVAWRPRHGAWELSARVDNLADRDYQTLIGFPGPGRGFWLGVRVASGAEPAAAAR